MELPKTGIRTSIAITATCLLFTSCSKEYTCECSGGITGDSYEYTVNGVSRVVASNRCEKNNPPPNRPDGNYCELQ